MDSLHQFMVVDLVDISNAENSPLHQSPLDFPHTLIATELKASERIKTVDNQVTWIGEMVL